MNTRLRRGYELIFCKCMHKGMFHIIMTKQLCVVTMHWQILNTTAAVTMTQSRNIEKALELSKYMPSYLILYQKITCAGIGIFYQNVTFQLYLAHLGELLSHRTKFGGIKGTPPFVLPSVRPTIRTYVRPSVRPGDNSNTVGPILFIFCTHVPYGGRSSARKPIFKMAARFKMAAILVSILQ